MIKKIFIENYRGFKKHNIEFKDLTLMVGKNNAGKSTIIEILRLTSLITKRYKTAKYIETPTWVQNLHTDESRYRIRGISPDIKKLIRQYHTIFHRYSDEQAYAKIIFTNNLEIEIYFNTSEQIFAILRDQNGDVIKSPTKAKSIILPNISTLPQIGPLNVDEKIIQDEHIKKSELLSVTSLHFRNKILNNKEMLSRYNELIQKNWSGLSIESIDKNQDSYLSLMIRENDFVAEAGVMGHGLQMWLQILWFIFTSVDSTTLIVDEPDVYLHADLQKKLYKLLLRTGKQIILSSHSLEFIFETEPKNILIVQKDKSKSSYAGLLPEVQKVIDDIGYSSNLELIKFADTGKCLYVEGYDTKILSCFAKILKYDNFEDIPVFSIGGKSQWQKILGGHIVASKSTSNAIKSYCVLDKDYCLEENNIKMMEDAKRQGINLFIWTSKEIENYLINPNVLYRLINKNEEKITLDKLICFIDKILEENKGMVIEKIGNQIQQNDRSFAFSTISANANEIINKSWNTFEDRVKMCSGKEVLSRIRTEVQDSFGISFSNVKIAKSFNINEIHPDIVNFLRQISNA